MERVVFNRPWIPSSARENLVASLNSGHLSGDGVQSRRASKLLSEMTGSPSCLLTPSGTHGLELAMSLLELSPGDEVIVPSFTFSSTAAAVVQAGGTPVFVDIEPDTLNIDPAAVLEAVNERTRAVVPIHYAGIAANITPIMELCAKYQLTMIEDAAHALGGHHLGSPLGGIGSLGALSFHETKNLQCGEGGAILINDEQFMRRAEILREKGTDRSRFFRGEVDKYGWVDRGSSWLLADPLAAILNGQLSEFSKIQESRRRTWVSYADSLENWAKDNGVLTPKIPVYADPSWHIFYLILPDSEERDRLIKHTSDLGVHTTFHYQPLDSSVAGRRFGRTSGTCPITQSISGRLVRLPLWTHMPDSVSDRVIASVQSFKTECN
jgi:dTDP-4-amino-4,6-dideoxygalactose transaminase